MKANFIRKPSAEELIPQDAFVIEKTLILDEAKFEAFLKDPLSDYDFIKENVGLMHCDGEGVFHCLFITSPSHDFGILIESEGYHYARYAAFIPLPKAQD